MEILSAARTAREYGPLCDACLGRCFGDRSRGLTNHERGRAIRTVLAMVDDEPIEAPRVEACWVCEGLTDRYDDLAEEIADKVESISFSTYQVGTRVPSFLTENDRLLREEVRGAPSAGEVLKRECNREIGKRVGRLTDARVDFERPDVAILVDLEADDIEVSINSAFVYGRYRKLERGIPQTEWPCSDCNGTGRRNDEVCSGCDGSGYRYDRSVEQLIAPHICEAMDGASATFHGAGREDVDARMLGTGRPFVVEVDAPGNREPDIDALSATINEAEAGVVEVEDLQLAAYTMVEHVKELDADKTYEAVVQIDPPIGEASLQTAIEELDGVVIEQETPNRVTHRRADLVRTREVYSMELVDFEASTATIRVHGAGGLYIKELLHGDAGRTTPSLAGLIDREVEVVSLDVVAVEAPDDATFTDSDHLLTIDEDSSNSSC